MKSGVVLDEDIVEELSDHAGIVYQTMRSDGSAPSEAQQHVIELIDSWCREAPRLRRRSNRTVHVDPPPLRSRRFTGLVSDIRYALRMLNRRWAFAILSITTMTIGIAIVTSLFSVVDAVFWKPLPWPEPDRIIRLTETRQGASRPHPLQISNGTYLAWQENPATIERLGGFWTNVMTMSGVGEASRIGIGHVTSSIFSVVRAKPLLGDIFTPEEEDASGNVILSYGLWQERFGGASNSQIFNAIARLRSGATVEQAAAEATARARSAPDGGLATLAFWGVNPKARIDISAAPALDALTREFRPALVAVTVAVALLFLAVIGNVANLQLAHTVARRREIAIRSSIGAGSGRIAQQLVTENIVLGIAGGAAGLVLAAVLHRVLPSLLPADFPRIDDIALDMRVGLFSGLLAVLTGLVVGALPALQVRRLSVVESLNEDQSGSIGGKRGRLPRARLGIIIGQTAIACILLISASLLSRSLIAMMQADRGYDATSLMTAVIPMPVATIPVQREIDVLDRIVDRVRGLPSVTHVAYTDGLPLTANETLSAFNMPSIRPPVGAPVQIQTVRHVVSEDYFQTFGMRVLRGRAFTPADTAGARHVVVVNRAFARQYLSDSAIGDRIVNFAGSFAQWEYEVAGIIDDVVEHGLTEAIQPEIYSPQRQTTFRSQNPGLAIRTNGDPRAVLHSLRSIVKEEDGSLALDSVMTMEDRLSSSLSKPRFFAVLLVAFALSSLLIAAVGLFGVLSYTVSQRKWEFALRTALGATPANLVRLVLTQGLLTTLCGLVAGTCVSFALVKYLGVFLYKFQAHDWMNFAGVSLIITVISLLACAGPAVRVIKIDPMRSLGMR